MKEKIWSIYCKGFEDGQASVFEDNADCFTIPDRAIFDNWFRINFEICKKDKLELIYGEDEG